MHAPASAMPCEGSDSYKLTLTFKVKETGFLERMNILDPVGNPVTLRRKARSMHGRWQIFKGESTDPKDLIFSAKTHSIFDLRTTLDVFLASNTAEKVCDFRLKGSFTERSCVVYAGDKHSKTIVAQMHKKGTVKSMLLGKDIFMVTAYPNIDYVFIVTLFLILDAVNQESDFAASAAVAGAVVAGAGASSAGAAVCC